MISFIWRDTGTELQTWLFHDCSFTVLRLKASEQTGAPNHPELEVCTSQPSDWTSVIVQKEMLVPAGTEAEVNVILQWKLGIKNESYCRYCSRLLRCCTYTQTVVFSICCSVLSSNLHPLLWHLISDIRCNNKVSEWFSLIVRVFLCPGDLCYATCKRRSKELGNRHRDNPLFLHFVLNYFTLSSK